jgi:hypothetical protein
MTRTTDPILTGWVTVGVVLAMLAVSILGWTLDDRTLNGVSIWAKPMKFNLSFALHLATLLVFVALMKPSARGRRAVGLTIVLTSAAVLVELLYIFVQAARGRASHFNFETQWETVAYYGLMGGAAVAVMLGTMVIGLAAWRGARDDIGAGLRTGILLGTVVSTVATFVTAGALASGSVTPTGHWIGGELSDANGLPITGWSTTGGDLRVAHFFATHLLQALPVLGWLADRARPRWASLTVFGGAAAGVAVVWLTFAQALAGRPFLVLSALQ